MFLFVYVVLHECDEVLSLGCLVVAVLVEWWINDHGDCGGGSEWAARLKVAKYSPSKILPSLKASKVTVTQRLPEIYIFVGVEAL